MTNNEFNDGIIALADNFQARRPHDRQIRRIYSKLSYLPDGKFGKMVDYVIDNYDMFKFSIKEFKNALKATPWIPQAEAQSNVACNLCNSTGFIGYTFKKAGRNLAYSARCDCDYGQQLSDQIPLYSDLFPGEVIYGKPKSKEQVATEDIRALLVLMDYPDLLKPIQGKPYAEWREYIRQPEIVNILMRG